MEKSLVFFIMFWPLCFCQLPLHQFREQFLKEINKFKPNFGDKVLEKTITKAAKSYPIEAILFLQIKSLI